MLPQFIDLFLHLDKYLITIVNDYNHLAYLILFVIVFLETGFVLTPFLPGDSLLFAVGSLSALGALNIFISLLILSLAAILGDSLNYAVGRYVGPKVFSSETNTLFNKKHLITTNRFYEKHGTKTILLARFVPIVRTFAPFVAGIGKMKYRTFLAYNVLGALLWVGIITIGGYLFGQIPIVKNNFSFVIIAIVIISFLPLIIPILREKLKSS